MASFVPTSSTSPGPRKNLEIIRLQTKRQEELDGKTEELQEIRADLNMVDYIPETMAYSRPASRAHSLSPSTSISPIRGITVEHRMISNLRTQLEDQASENKKLRQQIQSATARQSYSLTALDAATTPPATYGTVHRSQSETRFSTLPGVTETVESILARGSKRSPIQNVPLQTESATELLLRKQLNDAHAEITFINERLRQSENSQGQQKSEFRAAIEDLQARLNETIVGRDSVLELRKRESEGQEKMIAQLQQSVKALDAANRQQEKAVREAEHKIDSLQQVVEASTAALRQIRSLTWAQDQTSNPRSSLRYPSPSKLEDSTRPLPPSHVVRLVDECLRERLGRIRELEKVGAELKKELIETKKESEEKARTLAAEHREKLLHLSGDQEKQLETLTERAINARQQAAGLQAQLSNLQDQSTRQISLKTKELVTMENQYEDLKKAAEADNQQARQKIGELMSELDAYKDNMRAARDEISALQLKLAEANLNLQSNKEALVSVQSQLKDEREKTGDLRSQEGQRLSSIQRELEARSLEVRHMEEILVTYKEEAQARLQQKLFEVQCDEQKKAVDKTSQLLSEIETLTAENSRLSLEHLKKTSDCEQSQQSRDRLSSVLEETSAKLEAVQSASEDLTKQLEDKSKMVDILMQERDHYQSLSEERCKELDSATSLQNRLQVQVTERELQYEELCKQRVTLSQVVESNERTNTEARQERENMVKLLDEKNKELQEVKGLKDDLNRKFKVREKRLQSLEMEVKTLTEAVAQKNGEVEMVIEGKAGLLEELKMIQEKVTRLTTEREVLETRYVEVEASRDKNSSHLQLRIQALEHDLQLTLEALRATKSADARAIDVADNLQKELLTKRSEVDSLLNRTHWLEEGLSAANKEKSVMCAEKDLLQEQVSRMMGQVERLQHKLRSVADRRSSQKDIVSKLESTLEKAALKHSDAQRLIGEQEQTITKMTLRHQLDIKALQRTLASKLAPAHSAPTHSSSTERLTTLEKFQTTESAATLTKIKSCGTGRSSGGLVSAHFLQSARVQAMEGVTGRSLFAPVPVVIMNTSSTQAEPLVERQEKSDSTDVDHNLSAELKDLLQEMRSVFTTNMAALKSAASAGRQDIRTNSSPGKFGSSFEEREDSSALDRLNELLKGKDHHRLLIPARDTQSAPALGLPASRPDDVLDPPLLTSSPYKIDESASAPMNQQEPPAEPTPPPQRLLHPKKDLELHAPPSPVTNLLGLHTGRHSDPTLNGMNGHRVGAANEPSVNGRTEHSVDGPARYSVNRPTRHSASGSTRQRVSDANKHSVNATKAGSVPTAVYSVDTTKHLSNDFKQRVNNVKGSSSKEGYNRTHGEGPYAPRNGERDFSTQLKIQVPDSRLDGRTNEGGQSTVQGMNKRNRDYFDHGFGDVNAARELILSDDDSSITTVTSVSSASPKVDEPVQTSSLKSLRERLATLSQMGNQLQKGNKEMAGLIKRQDVKLKRCRQEERQAKRIVKAK